MIRYRAFALLLCAAALSSCEENQVQDIAGPTSGARIRFFNFGVNAPGVNFYAGDTKMTAISSTTGSESSTGVAYGGVGSGGFYGQIEPGQHTLTGRIAAAGADKDLAISSVTATLEDGKSYSFYQSGFYNSTAKTVDAFVVEDNFAEEIDWSVALVRFVNAMSNANPMALYVTHQTSGVVTKIGTEVAYKGASAFVAIPNGVYNLATRYADSTSNAITRTGVSFSAGRVYTITARGDITVTSTTATNRPFLDNTTNR
jgi:hypothetical protein